MQNMNIGQKERIFFFTYAITILSLLTYSVCDEKVKKNTTTEFSEWENTFSYISLLWHQQKKIYGLSEIVSNLFKPKNTTQNFIQNQSGRQFFVPQTDIPIRLLYHQTFKKISYTNRSRIIALHFNLELLLLLLFYLRRISSVIQCKELFVYRVQMNSK